MVDIDLTQPLEVNFVSACGGTQDDVIATTQSVAAAANANRDINYRHILVYNNGLDPDTLDLTVLDKPSNMEITVESLGELSSRATARNRGIELATVGTRSIVNFLDAGDLCLPETPIHKILDDEMDAGDSSDRRLFVTSAVVSGEGMLGVRHPVPHELRRFVNPFYIGAVFVPTDLAKRFHFVEGRKEDWKYWLTLIDEGGAVVKRLPGLSYIYTVKSSANHIRRKSALFREQYKFFNEYIGLGSRVRSCAHMAVHSLSLIHI